MRRKQVETALTDILASWRQYNKLKTQHIITLWSLYGYLYTQQTYSNISIR